MGENLRKIAMHITNEFVSQAVDTNFREGVATWCYPRIFGGLPLSLFHRCFEELWQFYVSSRSHAGVNNFERDPRSYFYPLHRISRCGDCYDRAKDYLKCALGYGCGLLVILSVLVVGFSKQLSGLFVKSDAVAAIVGTYFLIVSVGYILNTVTNCYLGALNGMGKPSKSMFLMIFYYIVVRMPLAYLLSYLGFGLNGIWVAVLVSHVVASVAAGISGTIAIKKRTSTT